MIDELQNSFFQLQDKCTVTGKTHWKSPLRAKYIRLTAGFIFLCQSPAILRYMPHRLRSRTVIRVRDLSKRDEEGDP